MPTRGERVRAIIKDQGLLDRRAQHGPRRVWSTLNSTELSSIALHEEAEPSLMSPDRATPGRAPPVLSRGRGRPGIAKGTRARIGRWEHRYEPETRAKNFATEILGAYYVIISASSAFR